MEPEMATDSTTIFDIIQFFRNYKPHDKLQTIINNEDDFDRICDRILRAIFRCAIQSKTPLRNKNLLRRGRIQEIAEEEKIITQVHNEILRQDKTLETSLSSEPSVAREHTEIPEQDTTLETERTEILESTTECIPALDNALSKELCPLPDTSTSTASDSAVELSDEITDENFAPQNSPQIEISANTEQEQTTPRHRTPVKGQKTKPKSPPDYATLEDTKEMILRFPDWTKEPYEKFWAVSTAAPRFEGQDASARRKVFVRDAITNIENLTIQTIQYRFTSILVYQSYQKLLGSGPITSNSVQQYLLYLNLPIKFEPDCLILLHGGLRRTEFCQDVAPDTDEIDYGSQTIPRLKDKLFDYKRNFRMPEKRKATVEIFRKQEINLWSVSSGAQSAAKAILDYGRKLLDLVDHVQTEHNRPNGQKRRGDFEVETSTKRTRTSAAASSPELRNNSPNTYQNAIISQPGFQTSSLSLRANQTISQPRLPNGSPNIPANPAVFQAGLRDSPLNLESNGQGLETLAQVALTNVSNEGTIHSETVSYREHTPSNGASNQSHSNLRTEINNLAPSQPNDNPPLETDVDIQSFSSYKDNNATGNFHEQCHARALEDLNWHSLFATIDNFDWDTVTLE